tara:strand:+ start:29 stop:247 length:219 start_codon:yes stop_codon:yes gene_type:complete
MTQTQNKMILKHLKKQGKIDPKQAYDKYSCMRLSARIFDLRGDDIHIETTYKMVKNKFGKKVKVAEYKLSGD